MLNNWFLQAPVSNSVAQFSWVFQWPGVMAVGTKDFGGQVWWINKSSFIEFNVQKVEMNWIKTRGLGTGAETMDRLIHIFSVLILIHRSDTTADTDTDSHTRALFTVLILYM